MGTGSPSLIDFRRRVGDLYRDVRACADPALGHARWRQGRDRLFADHPDSPLLTDDPRRRHGLPVADYDPELRFHAVLEPGGPLTLSVATGTDGSVEFVRLGCCARRWVAGRLVADRVRRGLWVPVHDGSCGSSSYGGGRYLLDTVKGADLGGRGDELVVDLNFLYNPSCAYDAAWACPLAPPGNRLDVVLAAGEGG